MKQHDDSISVMIYDSTTLEDGFSIEEDALASSWKYGGYLYKFLGKFDVCIDANNWEAALTHLNKLKNIREIQFWGHGSPGAAYIGKDKISLNTVYGVKARDKILRALLIQLKNKLTPDALIWFRTCSTFAGNEGVAFAEQFSSFMDCKVAGHTHEIGFFQSGLHSIRPSQSPKWSSSEGIEKGTPQDIKSIKKSSRKAPNTILCFKSTLPQGY